MPEPLMTPAEIWEQYPVTALGYEDAEGHVIYTIERDAHFGTDNGGEISGDETIAEVIYPFGDFDTIPLRDVPRFYETYFPEEEEDVEDWDEEEDF